MIKPEDKTVQINEEQVALFMTGKTIKLVDNSSVNVLNIEFTDGSEIMFDTEHAGSGLYGPVGYVRNPVHVHDFCGKLGEILLALRSTNIIDVKVDYKRLHASIYLRFNDDLIGELEIDYHTTKYCFQATLGIEFAIVDGDVSADPACWVGKLFGRLKATLDGKLPPRRKFLMSDLVAMGDVINE